MDTGKRPDLESMTYTVVAYDESDDGFDTFGSYAAGDLYMGIVRLCEAWRERNAGIFPSTDLDEVVERALHEAHEEERTRRVT